RSSIIILCSVAMAEHHESHAIEETPMEEDETLSTAPTLTGLPMDSRITVKLFDTSKSLFKRLSEDYDDKYENAKKLQAFLDCVLPGEQQKALVSLSRFLGLLPPFTNDGLASLRQLSRQDKLKRQKSIEAPEPDHSSFTEFFKQHTVEEEEDEEMKEGEKRVAGLFDQPGTSNVVV
ncbi:hypothetical protein PMAYCL1PPCAC_30936, partial [Pristionchus mayeri]